MQQQVGQQVLLARGQGPVHELATAAQTKPAEQLDADRAVAMALQPFDHVPDRKRNAT
jgi:hypothetical protein